MLHPKLLESINTPHIRVFLETAEGHLDDSLVGLGNSSINLAEQANLGMNLPMIMHGSSLLYEVGDEVERDTVANYTENLDKVKLCKLIPSDQQEIYKSSGGRKATPCPPVGPAFGSKGVKIMAFYNDDNARIAGKASYVIPVDITIYNDKSFTFILKALPTSILIEAVHPTSVSQIPHPQVDKRDMSEVYGSAISASSGMHSHSIGHSHRQDQDQYSACGNNVKAIALEVEEEVGSRLKALRLLGWGTIGCLDGNHFPLPSMGAAAAALK
ncbi:hypothetical protein ACH5RR_041424 [Cinchona calisaya]|uniref:Large ribosomal subunit protein uL11 N-terminal domain-containing protein n=1 Tax=Cinchona calisaya TaxID=153742 RepID=A0ABD2XYS3_9GENT